MIFKKAVKWCHVSGAIYRAGNPTKKYNKNHTIPLVERVPLTEQQYDDWEEYDPDAEFGHY